MDYKKIIEFSSAEYLAEKAKIYYEFLWQNNIRIPASGFKDMLMRHPSFPTIVAFLDTCESIGINASIVASQAAGENVKAKLLRLSGNSINDLIPSEIVRCLPSVENEGQEGEYYIVVKNKLNPTNHVYTGLLQDDKKYKYKFTVKIFLFLMSISLLLYSGTESQYAIYNAVNLILSGVGVYVAILIFYFFNGMNAASGPKLCDVGAESEGCHKAINFTPFKKLPVDIPSLTMSLFVSHLLISLVSFVFPPLTSFLVIVSLCSLIAVFISIILQKFILKAWCKLCLLVAAIITLQSLLFALFLSQNPLFLTLGYLTFGVAVVSLSILVSSAYSDVFPSIINFRAVEQKHARIKTSPFYIEKSNFLKKVHFPDNKLDLVLGDEDVKVEIQLLLSLDCGGCALMFEEVNEILKHNIPGLGVRIKLKPTGEIDLNKEVWKLTYAKQYVDAFSLMHTLFRKGKLPKGRVAGESQDIEGAFKELLDWQVSEDIQYSPLLLINGHMFININIEEMLVFIRREARLSNGDLTKLSIEG